MTMRERLADWLTGGELTRALRRAEGFRKACEINDEAVRRHEDAYLAMSKRQCDQRRALREISESETIGANATVKRMARIAREALKA